MNYNKQNILANRLARAFLKNKIIKPLPSSLTKKLSVADNFRRLCESKINKPIIGFKAGGTGLPLIKKLNEKEPFVASIYKHNVKKNNKTIRINKYTLGIELEVCYFIKKDFFKFNKKITLTNIKKFIIKIAPCIEVVGYRQKKTGIKSFGDLSSDFGANIKFVIGPSKKYRNNFNVKNLKTKIFNVRENKATYGNTNTVYINPVNSLLFVLKKLKKNKIYHDKDFYVFTGSTVGVVPISFKGLFIGKINNLGTVKARIS